MYDRSEEGMFASASSSAVHVSTLAFRGTLLQTRKSLVVEPYAAPLVAASAHERRRVQQQQGDSNAGDIVEPSAIIGEWMRSAADGDIINPCVQSVQWSRSGRMRRADPSFLAGM